MVTWIALVLIVILLFTSLVFGQGEDSTKSRKDKKKDRVNPQKIALEKWANSLTERDYNYEEWKIMFNSTSAVKFFNGYAKKLSDLFKEDNAKVNFAMIGQCSKYTGIVVENDGLCYFPVICKLAYNWLSCIL